MHRADQRDVALYREDRGQIQWRITKYNGAGEHKVESDVVPANEWTHCVGTYDGKIQRLYINGRLAGVLEWAGTVDWDDRFLAEGIGGQSWDKHQRFLGSIDDVRVYDRALSADEVAELSRR